jgi:hypothetical protein
MVESAGSPPASGNCQDTYSSDPNFIEHAYRLPSLAHLLKSPNAVGVARFLTLPAFTPERILTLIYTDAAVAVTIAIGNTSLYHSLSKDSRRNFDPSAADCRSKTLSLSTGRVPSLISTWTQLKSEALQAPSCRTEFCCDGVSYWHRILDHEIGLDAKWSNPRQANHERQWELIAAYAAIVQSANLFPEQHDEAKRRSKKNRIEREAWRRKQKKRKQSRK